jgi:hypothetical protein
MVGMQGKFRPSPKMGSLAALEYRTLTFPDPSSIHSHSRGHSCVSACPLAQSLRARASSRVLSWRRTQGTKRGEGPICATCNQSGHDCNGWRGGGEPTDSPHSCSSPPSPGPGAWRGQDGAAAASTAKLLSRVQPQLSTAPSPRGFPMFSPVFPSSVLLSFEKEEMGGTRACRTPEIRLQAGAGGRLRGAGGAWCFPSFSELRDSPRLASPPGPAHQDRGC